MEGEELGMEGPESDWEDRDIEERIKTLEADRDSAKAERNKPLKENTDLKKKTSIKALQAKAEKVVEEESAILYIAQAATAFQEVICQKVLPNTFSGCYH